jgi:DNA-binding MarR family transcriptional regulator
MKTEHIIALIARVRDSAYAFIISELNKKQITRLVPSHGAILSHLFQKDRATMKELADKIGRDKSTLTALASKLAAAGYVTKETDPVDSRITRLCLTSRGKSLRPAFDEISDRLISTAFSGFTRKEKENTVKLIGKMLDNFYTK